MLYKNDELVKLTPEMEKEVYKELGAKNGLKTEVKFPIVIKMPDYMYTPQRPGSKNTKPDRPASANIRLDAARHGVEGSEHWNYCTGRKKADRGEKWIYFSNAQGAQTNVLSFTETYSIDDKNIDLLYFLLFLSPLREIPFESQESRARRGVKPNQRFMFVVQNKEKEAELRITKRQQKLRIESAVIGDNCIKLDKLRIIAASLRIDDSMGKEEYELRDEVLATVDGLEKANKGGYDKFLELANMDSETGDSATTVIKATIQKAIEMKLIRQDIRTATWCWVKEGKNGGAITKTVANKSLRDSLDWYFENHPAKYAELEMAIREAESLIDA